MQGAFKSIIKSIQRGTGSGNSTITISPIDPNRCIIFLQGCNIGEIVVSTYSHVETSTQARPTDITSTSFYINGEGDYTWQVIEFN